MKHVQTALKVKARASAAGKAPEPAPSLPAPRQPDEGRHAPRKALRSSAILRLDGVRGQVTCLVLDISATGAKLRLQLIDARPFDPAMSLPETSKLFLPNDRIEIDCKLAWRTAKEIGVVFVSNFRPVRLPANGAPAKAADVKTVGRRRPTPARVP